VAVGELEGGGNQRSKAPYNNGGVGMAKPEARTGEMGAALPPFPLQLQELPQRQRLDHPRLLLPRPQPLSLYPPLLPLCQLHHIRVQQV